VRPADEIYNELRDKLRDKLGCDDKEITKLLNEFWDAAYSEGAVRH
jgi:hypothetical protein